MSAKRPPRLRLFDILDCIAGIDGALKDTTLDDLRSDIVRYRAVERWLEIISEASRHIEDELRAREPEVPWKQVANFGNFMRHGYEAIDPLIVWNIIRHDLPVLKAAAERLYAAVKTPTDPWPNAQSK